MLLAPIFLGLLALLSTPDQQTQQNPPNPTPAPARERSRASMGGAAQRNQNVPVFQIDNEAIKEANIRLGNTITIVSEARVETSHYATEHGRPAAEQVWLAAPSSAPGWHAEWFESHLNGAFNARTFFQVGEVLPSRGNVYGARFTGDLGRFGQLTWNGSQRKIRGVVNGNVLVPLANERTPLATDPATRALVTRFLAAYPGQLPNRPDFDPRALNTNAPQRIDELDTTLRWDKDTDGRGRLSLDYTPRRQRTDAFQLVAGQNPDTGIHSHRARLTYRRAFTPATDLAAGVAFNRVKSVLRPEPNAVGPRARLGYQFEELGPDSMFPIDRAQNSYRAGLLLAHQAAGGRHAITLGGEFARFQLNGIETSNQRGFYQFTNNFGNTAAGNFRLGLPSMYEVSIGELARGFRNFSAGLFVADRWKINSRLQVYAGLRYGAVSAPVEVDHLTPIPYRSDANNFSPRFSLAWEAGGGWTARASYAVSFGEIPPVTFQQARNNLPMVRYIQVQNPPLVNPITAILQDPHARTSPTLLSPDLVSPYAHQYNLSFERRWLNRYQFRMGYVGSRGFKLINAFVQNRAEAVDGIPLTTETVDQRRPDARYYEIKRIVNGGIAYLDAARVSLDMPLARGLAWSVSYTFSKAIDSGSDFAFTAANKDLGSARSQSQYDSFTDKKSLSTFDSTHALLIAYSYDLPRFLPARGALGWLSGGWQVSGVTLLKSGTPFTLYVGSDGPGFGNVDGGPSDRPNIVDPSILGMTVDHPNTAPSILRRDRFAYIAPGQPRGSLGRNTFRKDGIANFNAAVTKQWRWQARREWTFLLRGEAYNLTNHPQFDEPQRNLTSPAFGKITNTLNDGRVLQIGLRLVL
jgi:hypothetical protein